MGVQEQQTRQLRKLLNRASETEVGRTHNFKQIEKYSDFRREVPQFRYQDIKDQIEELKKGKKDLFWPGSVHKFSVSAGTTGRGKHLPLSTERLRSDQRFIRKTAFQYFRQRWNLSPLMGKHISLPGSLDQVNIDDRRIDIGEISGHLGTLTPWLLRWHQVVSTEELIKLSFSKKFNRIKEASINRDIRVITAVPSWTLTLFQEILEDTGKDSIDEVWPNLKLIICGGVKLENYRSYLQSLCGRLNPDFIETYGASEGYFAFTDRLSRNDMKLVMDNGIFYEWIPVQDSDGETASRSTPPIPTWQVRPGQKYQMLVSTNAGLWRYAVNDVIEFTSISPPRILVRGRVEEVLDPYGEAVYGWEAEKALKKACSSLGIGWVRFSVGSLLEDEHERPRHHWFIEFEEPGHISSTHLDKLTQRLDNQLRTVNRHYAIRRESGALAPPKIHIINRVVVQRWLRQRNKTGAQNKLPRIIKGEEALRQFEKLSNRIAANP